MSSSSPLGECLITLVNPAQNLSCLGSLPRFLKAEFSCLLDVFSVFPQKPVPILSSALITLFYNPNQIKRQVR